MKASFVCDGCGLCCQHLIVEADALDMLREPRIQIERPVGPRPDSLSLLDACWILAVPGRPCPFLSKARRCGIYPTRPRTCVTFMAGSAQCQELRQEFRLPVLTPLPTVDDVLGEICSQLFEEQASSESASTTPSAI